MNGGAVYERVLLTTDGSVLSRAALEHAARLVDRARGEVRVLAVAEGLPRFPAQAATVSSAGLTVQVAEELTAGARVHAETLRSVLEAAGVAHASIEIASGSPGETIAARAREQSCDAVVMATHGRSGLARTLLGSVADHVVSHLRDIPVVLIRPTAEQEVQLRDPHWADTAARALAELAPYRDVLVGLDGSALAMKVLPFAVRACDTEAGRTHLVHVIDTLPRSVRGDTESGERDTSLGEREAAATYAAAQQSLAAAGARATALGARTVVTSVLGGVPEDALTEYARAQAVELLAMTTRGRSGVTRALLGSVPDAVLRHLTGTPLLLLHPSS